MRFPNRLVESFVGTVRDQERSSLKFPHSQVEVRQGHNNIRSLSPSCQISKVGILLLGTSTTWFLRAEVASIAPSKLERGE